MHLKILSMLIGSMLMACVLTCSIRPVQAESQVDTQVSLRTLQGTVITMISEKDGLPMRFWAKDNSFRGEITSGNRKIISIQRGNKNYTYEQGGKEGTLVETKRGLASMGLVRQIQDIKRLGKKNDAVEIEGETHDVFIYDVNIPEESAIVYLSRKTSLPRLWISVIRTANDRAEGNRMIFTDLKANHEIPDELFQIPPDVQFSGDDSQKESGNDLRSPILKKPDPKLDAVQSNAAKEWAVTKASNTKLQLENGDSIILSAGELVRRKESNEGSILIQTPIYQGRIDSNELIPMQEADAYFSSKIDADPNDADAILGRARLILALTAIQPSDADGSAVMLKLSLMDFNRIVRLKPSASALADRASAFAMMNRNQEAIKDLDAANALDPTNRDILRRRLDVLLRTENFDRALLDCDTLIGMNQGDAEAHSLRCFVLGNKGEFDEAMLACDTAISFDKNYSKAYLYRGLLWDSSENPGKARADYSNAVNLGDKFARLTRARFLLRQGKPREAIADLNDVLQDDPSNWDLYVDRGAAWLDLGESDKAIEDINTYLKNKPARADALMIRGSGYSFKAEFDKAIEDFTKAIELSPASHKLYSYRAWAYVSSKSYRSAIDDYTRFLALSPDNLDALINRGLAYYFLQQHKEAVRDFSQAIDLAPDQSRIYVLRGSARNGLKTYKEAIDDFTHAIQLEPNNTEAYTYRGVAWLRLSNRDKAIKDFNKALELDPLRDEALVNRGSYWFTVKEFKKAISDWEKAWSLNPKNPDVAHQLASIFLDCEDSSLRDSTKALAYATSACELTQWNNFGHLRTLAKAYADTSNFPSAVKWIQRALELAPQEEKTSCQELLERYKNNKK